MSVQLQPPELPVSLIKTEPLAQIKNEQSEIGMDDIFDSSDKEIILDVKSIEIVSHILCEESIKSETETQVFVKTENNPENLKTEDTSDERDQRVGDIQDSNEDTLGKHKTREQLRSRKLKQPEKIDFAKCYRISEATSWEEDKAKIKVIKASVPPVEPHEYTSLAKNKHVCNHCQHAFKNLKYVRFHIKKIHRKVKTMYQCPYCPHKSKWSLRCHIIQVHKDTKDIQWFQCHLCEMKFKLKWRMTEHMKVHFTHEQMGDNLKFCPMCGKGFKALSAAKKHIRLIHNKEGKTHKCPECEYTTTERKLLIYHIKTSHKNHEKRYCCEKCPYVSERHYHVKRHELSHKTKVELDDRNMHKLIHRKPEEIQYFYCYHCSYKNQRKHRLKLHIFRHFQNGDVPFHCYICNFVTLSRELIVEHIKEHSKFQIKREIKEES